MNIKRSVVCLAAAVVLLAITHQAAAQPSWEATFSMTVMPYGETCSASGWTHIGRKVDQEFIEVQAFAKLPDGSVLTVWAQNSAEKWFEIGKAQLLLGAAKIEVLADPSQENQPMFPLSQIKRVRVYHGRSGMLDTNFLGLPLN